MAEAVAATGDVSSGNELGSAKRLTRELLGALSISRVISVDDDHAASQMQSREDVVGALRAGRLDPAQVARFILPDEQDGSVELIGVEDAIALINQRWDRLEETNRVELTLAASHAVDAGAVEDQTEEVAGDIAALLTLPDLLGDDIEYIRMGLVEWRASGQGLLDARTRTLLLVDRSFENEGQSATAGDDLIRGVLARDDRPHVYAGLLTHTASDAGREKEIAKEIAGDTAQTRPLIVVAKGRLLTESFPEALRALLFAKEVEGFRAHAIQSLEEASAKGVEFLRGVDRYALLASFEAARSEGVFETDFAMRMPTAVVRKHLTRALRTRNFLTGPLEALRSAAGIDLYFGGAKRPIEIAQIEWDERFDDAEYLASLALPLEVGDVFRVHDLLGDGGERYYVLLAQACDLTVRNGGKRSNDLKSLVLTQVRRAVKDPKTGSNRPLKRNQAEIGALLPSEADVWRVEFAKQLHVTTLALDACVTSGTGRSVIKREGNASESLPSSWSQRFERMKSEAATMIDMFRGLAQAISIADDKEDEARSLRIHLSASLLGTSTTHQEGLTARIVEAEETVEFGLERYARISDNTARGLFALLVNHQARPAFAGPLFIDTEGHD